MTTDNNNNNNNNNNSNNSNNNDDGDESDGARRWYEALKRLDALQDVYEIVQAVANGATEYRDREDEYCTQDPNCMWRQPHPNAPIQMVHTERCIVTKARRILGK